MKPLLSLLMVYVLMQVQAQALSGGPTFSTGGTNVGLTVGTFAGVLIPKSSTNSSGLNVTSNSNSLGIFLLSAPSSGLATGNFSYFDSGATYVGTITGIIDPQKSRLRAIVKGQFNFEETLSSGGSSATLLFPNGYCTGSLDAKVKQGGDFVVAARLNGNADLDVQAADAIGLPVGAVRSLVLTIDGFKQSSVAGTTADLSSLLNPAITGSTSGG